MIRKRDRRVSNNPDALLQYGPLVRVQLSLSHTAWRIGPAWSALAGAFAVGWAPDRAGALLQLAAIVVLGDLAWGGLRQIVPSGPVRPRSTGIAVLGLPYVSPEAPLSRFLNRLEGDATSPAAAAWQSLMVTLLMVALLSFLLGAAALALSAGVIVVVALAWLLVVNRGTQPGLSLALLDVAAPWLLGMSIGGPEAFAVEHLPGPLLIMAGFTLLQWGVYRAGQLGARSLTGLWVGQGAVLLALIAVRMAGACAIVAILFAPASWWLLSCPREGLIRARPWWFAAMIVAAAAQTIHLS